MSDYWVSRKKYFCKYCEIYIADDAPSRQQHENGLRHKGNKERFVRNLYKQGERRKNDLEEEKREMARVEQAANAAYARDVSTGLASASSSGAGPSKPSTSSAVTSSNKPEKPASPFANYSTAQSLGYTDPDAERLAAEAERRRTQGLVGEWETVAPPPPPLPGESEETENKDDLADGISGKKRRTAENAEDVDDTRRFKVRKRTLSVGLGELWDPGDIPVKLKSDRFVANSLNGTGVASSAAADSAANLKSSVEESGTQEGVGFLASKPKWTPKGWKRAIPESGEGHDSADVSDGRANDGTSQVVSTSEGVTASEPADVKPDPSVMQSQVQPSKEESTIRSISTPPESTDIQQMADDNQSLLTPTDTSGGAPSTGMFRKRKIPAGNRGRR